MPSGIHLEISEKYFPLYPVGLHDLPSTPLDAFCISTAVSAPVVENRIGCK